MGKKAWEERMGGGGGGGEGKGGGGRLSKGHTHNPWTYAKKKTNFYPGGNKTGDKIRGRLSTPPMLLTCVPHVSVWLQSLNHVIW